MGHQDILSRLQDIERHMGELNERMNRERLLWQAELEERQRLGITGEKESLEHYRRFMEAHGIPDNEN